MTASPRTLSAGAVGILALLLVGCTNSEDADPPDSTEQSTQEPVVGDQDGQGEPVPFEDVDVTVECTRGGTLSTAPVDTSGIAFLEGAPDETAWVQRVVTVENRSESSVRADPDAAVRYLDESGTPITEASLGEPYPPALVAAAGQTVNRVTIRFDVDTQGGLVEDPAASDAMFSTLDSCEFPDNPEVLSVTDGEFVNPELAGQIELTDCGLTADGTMYEGTFRVQNPTDSPINVELGFEILDENGDRLGTGGNESDTVPAGGEATIRGFAAAFTVVDVDTAADCATLSATIA